MDSALPIESSLISLPGDWQITTPDLRETNPGAPWPWLLEEGSLTRRLQELCADGFNLRLLGEAEIKLAEREASLLDAAAGAPARAREVYLACGESPYIYAFSLLPYTTLRGGGRYLNGLGSRPLGDALFSDPSLERGQIEITRLQPGTAFHSRVLQGCPASNEPIWGRRSVFRTGGSTLLVCEFFLPALLQNS